MAMFNEIAVSLYLYQAILLADSAIDDELRPMIGNMMGLFVIGVLAVNILRGLLKAFNAIKLWYKKRKMEILRKDRNNTVSIKPEIIETRYQPDPPIEKPVVEIKSISEEEEEEDEIEEESELSMNTEEPINT
jgi:hypothetical protein